MRKHHALSSKAVGIPPLRCQSGEEDAGALTYEVHYIKTTHHSEHTSGLSYKESRIGLRQVRLDDRPYGTQGEQAE